MLTAFYSCSITLGGFSIPSIFFTRI